MIKITQEKILTYGKGSFEVLFFVDKVYKDHLTGELTSKNIGSFNNYDAALKCKKESQKNEL